MKQSLTLAAAYQTDEASLTFLHAADVAQLGGLVLSFLASTGTNVQRVLLTDGPGADLSQTNTQQET